LTTPGLVNGHTLDTPKEGWIWGAFVSTLPSPPRSNDLVWLQVR
jgi:hypothetical protein